jgi:hypothetical protein
MSNRAGFWFMVGFILVIVISFISYAPEIMGVKQKLQNKAVGYDQLNY